MHNLTVQAGTGHLVRLMLFNMEMGKGFKFSPKFKQLQVGATSSQQVENFFESKTSVHSLFSFLLSPVHMLSHILNTSY